MGDEFVLIGQEYVYVGTAKRLRRIGIVSRSYREGGSSQIELAAGGEVISPSSNSGATFRQSSTSSRAALTKAELPPSRFSEALRTAR